MNYSLIPRNTPHACVNFFRAPYGKKLQPSHTVQGTSDNFKVRIDILFDTFLENYNNFLAGNMKRGVKFYKNNGIPEPSQYKAFKKFIKLFEEEEYVFLNKKIFFCCNTKLMSNPSCNGVFEYLELIANNDFAEQEKKLTFVSGSFWRMNLIIREKIINCLKVLHNKGIEVYLYTQAKENEDLMDRILPIINKESRIGLNNRIPIHYICYANSNYFLEFPHTEDITVRLNMYMDLNDVFFIKSKSCVNQYFNNLITEAT